MLMSLLVQNLVFVGLALYDWRRKRLTLAQVGAAWPSWSHILRGIVWGIGMFALAYGVGLLLTTMLHVLLPPARYTELLRFHRASTAEGVFDRLAASRVGQWGFIFIGVVIAPICEEALFRGLIFRTLRRRWGVGVGVCVSALIFALVHVSPLTIGVIFVIGVLLALAYERTGSLWTPIIMHAVNNGLMFALLWQQNRTS